MGQNSVKEKKSVRFEDFARELGCDKSEADFNKDLKRLDLKTDSDSGNSTTWR